MRRRSANFIKARRADHTLHSTGRIYDGICTSTCYAPWLLDIGGESIYVANFEYERGEPCWVGD
jgi:hypothetical protein